MKRWRLVVAVGLVAAAVLVARPVRAQDEAYESTPTETETDDVWSDVGWGVLTGLANVVYVPAKLVYAGLGGLTGGLALGLTGGELGTAQSIWEPSLGGDFFLTPEMIQGEEGISFAGAPPDLGATTPADTPSTPDHDSRYGS